MLSLLACVFYVVETYNPNPNQAPKLIAMELEYVLTGIFTFDYLLCLYSADHRWRYLFSTHGLIDLARSRDDPSFPHEHCCYHCAWSPPDRRARSQ